MPSKSFSDANIRDQAEQIATLLNEYMLEYPNNSTLLQTVLAELFGSVQNFEESFYEHLTDKQKKEFQRLVDALAREERDKKQRFHKLLNVAGFQDIVSALQKAQVGRAAKVQPNDRINPDSSPHGAPRPTPQKGERRNP
jgi:hypothetical protein